MSYKVQSPIPVKEGGTGDITVVAHAVIVGEGTTGFSSVGPGTTGQLLTGVTGSDPVWASPATSSISITGDTGGALTGSSFTFTGGTTGLTFAGSGTTETVGGTLVVSNGGTGRATLTNHGVLVGAGTGAITQLSVGTTGQVLTGSTGADPVWASPAASSISITGDSGGALTGSSFTFTGGTTGLTFSGSSSTETVGGTLVVSNGGTGLSTTTTPYGVVCAGTTSTGPLQVISSLGTSGQVLTSQGASSLPHWTTVSGGSGITTINGDTGSVTGSTVTFTAGGGFNNCGATVKFSGSSTTMDFLVTDANNNTFVGGSTGATGNTGGNNTAFGAGALGIITTAGASNTCIGQAAGAAMTSGTNNVVIGFETDGSITGTGNIIIGSQSGTGYTGGENENIIIGYNSSGITGESGVTRIGTPSVTTAVYINGIYEGTSSIADQVVVSNSGDKIVSIVAGTTGQVLTSAGSGAIPVWSTPSYSLAWSVITANQTAAVNNGYICNKAGTLALALPASAAVGSIIEVTGINTATGWQITQATGQQIFFGTSSTTSGATGTLTSSAIRDAIRMVCITANTTWQVLSSIGNITVV